MRPPPPAQRPNVEGNCRLGAVVSHPQVQSTVYLLQYSSCPLGHDKYCATANVKRGTKKKNLIASRSIDVSNRWYRVRRKTRKSRHQSQMPPKEKRKEKKVCQVRPLLTKVNKLCACVCNKTAMRLSPSLSVGKKRGGGARRVVSVPSSHTAPRFRPAERLLHTYYYYYYMLSYSSVVVGPKLSVLALCQVSRPFAIVVALRPFFFVCV